MMADGGDQAKFLAGLRAFAEKHAANNPTLAKLRILGKALVDESRRRFNQGEPSATLGAYLLPNNELRIICPNSNGDKAQLEIVGTLRQLAAAGQIKGGACSTILQRPLVPNGPNVPFVDVHVELVEGLALRSAVPVDEFYIQEGVPGVKGPYLPIYGKKVKPRIFVQTPEI